MWTEEEKYIGIPCDLRPTSRMLPLMLLHTLTSYPLPVLCFEFQMDACIHLANYNLNTTIFPQTLCTRRTYHTQAYEYGDWHPWLYSKLSTFLQQGRSHVGCNNSMKDCQLTTLSWECAISTGRFDARKMHDSAFAILDLDKDQTKRLIWRRRAIRQRNTPSFRIA